MEVDQLEPVEACELVVSQMLNDMFERIIQSCDEEGVIDLTKSSDDANAKKEVSLASNVRITNQNQARKFKYSVAESEVLIYSAEQKGVQSRPPSSIPGQTSCCSSA
jgi:hypothetical protein